jgi:hypothetical protein
MLAKTVNHETFHFCFDEIAFFHCGIDKLDPHSRRGFLGGIFRCDDPFHFSFQGNRLSEGRDFQFKDKFCVDGERCFSFDESAAPTDVSGIIREESVESPIFNFQFDWGPGMVASFVRRNIFHVCTLCSCDIELYFAISGNYRKPRISIYLIDHN